MPLRAAAVWLLLLIVAFASATARVALLQPRLGERIAHQLGTLVVVALFAAVIWGTVRWVDPGLDRGRLVALGVAWAAATLLFEFGFGHWVAGHSWSRLFADYDLLAGRLWLLVLLTVLLGPVVAGGIRRG